jgi:cephalosporin hydroxylase
MDDAAVIRRFYELWYKEYEGAWERNSWLGIPTAQNPMDVWITQEIVTEVKPDVFIETGAWKGGSAALWASILEHVNPGGRVISIDVQDRMSEARALPLVRQRVEFVLGSSADPAIAARIARRVRGKKVMVLLDSDHRRRHVLQELRLYAPLVTVGSYLIVQDTVINGHPLLPNWGDGDGGPMEALREFLAGTDEFVVDASRERMLFTFCPSGFLKRVKPARPAGGAAEPAS